MRNSSSLVWLTALLMALLVSVLTVDFWVISSVHTLSAADCCEP